MKPWECGRCSFKTSEVVEITEHAMRHAFDEQMQYLEKRIYPPAYAVGPLDWTSGELLSTSTATCLLSKQTHEIHLRCYNCPYCEPGCVFCAPISIEEGDELRALVEAELLLSGHWHDRHDCNCGKCFWSRGEE